MVGNACGMIIIDDNKHVCDDVCSENNSFNNSSATVLDGSECISDDV